MASFMSLYLVGTIESVGCLSLWNISLLLKTDLKRIPKIPVLKYLPTLIFVTVAYLPLAKTSH